MSKILLLDGHSIARRAFHAQEKSGMSTSDGRPTFAVAGFMSMLAKMLTTSDPQYLGVVFDAPGPTFRHERLDSYKAQRKPPPEGFPEQLAMLKDLLAACGIETVEVSGVEADDVLASYAEAARQEGLTVEVATGDRDSYQLVSDPDISVLYMSGRAGADYEPFTEAKVVDKVGVTPQLYVDYAALVGDASDNLPGVPSIGPKTAVKLITTYGGVDEILAQVSELPPKQAAKLSESAELLALNKELMTLVRDVELPKTIAELERRPPQLDTMASKLAELEFNKLAERVAAALGVSLGDLKAELEGQSDVLECELDSLPSAAAAVKLLESLAAAQAELGVGVALGSLDESLPQGTALAQRKVKGVAIYDASGGAGSGGTGCQVAWLSGKLYREAKVQAALRQVFQNCPVSAHSAKDWLRRLREDGIEVAQLQMDTELASFLLESTGSSSDIRRLLKIHTGKVLPEPEVDAGQLSLDAGDSASDLDGEHAAQEAVAAALLRQPMLSKLAAEKMESLLVDMELPLLSVIVKMEQLGIGVDPAVLDELNATLSAQVDELTAKIHKLAGREFNVNSPKQLQEILFDDLQLTPSRQTKRGPSTNAESLNKLRDDHEIIEYLLEYREVEKLRSTYAEGLQKTIDRDANRIRASFNQMGSSTGRLSSEAPNLHNIPVRTPQGKQFRKVFVAQDGYSLVVADYDQIELRCIAHLAKDEGLIKAFTDGADVHVAVASQVFEVKPAEVTPEQRNRAKAVSYGLVYGMEAFGLAQRLRLPQDEAQQIVDDYFGAFASVDGYMKDTIEQARQRGYTETLLGRRRRIPGLSDSTPRHQRREAERQAMNAGIQGLAADIFKLALVHCDQELLKRGLQTAIVLQVHDEIIFEAPDSEVDEVKQLAQEVMGSAYKLKVPLVVSIAAGKTWADAKS